MKVRTRKGNKNSALLISLAESIGSTLGTFAAKANAAQKAITRSRAAHSVRHEAKKLMGKSVARKTRRSAPTKVRKNKRVRASRVRLRRAT